MFNVSWRGERVNNNATVRSDIRKSDNCNSGAAEQHSQAVYLHVLTVHNIYINLI